MSIKIGPRTLNVLSVYCSTAENMSGKRDIITKALAKVKVEDWILGGDLNLKDLDFSGRTVYNPEYNATAQDGRVLRRSKVDYIIASGELRLEETG